MSRRDRSAGDSASYWVHRGAPGGRVPTRTGLVRADGKAVRDDTGSFHPLGVTLFWALYGWKFERDKLLATLAWLATKGFDYVRILGEVDWTGRSIEPSWPDYPDVLRAFVDTAYDQFGLRSEISIVGGRQFDKTSGDRRFIPSTFALRVAQALDGVEHKVLHYECANEWDRLDKVSMEDLVKMAQVLVAATPNLVALSRPSGAREHEQWLRHAKDEGFELPITDAMLAEDKAEVLSGYGQMKLATKEAGASAFTLHPRRSTHDYGWSHVRQGYDFKDFPNVVFNGEPEGPQSSVVPMDNPLQLACCRLLGMLCGGAGYVLHVGQGVTGEANIAYGRPEFMWEVPNIDHVMEVVRGVDVLAPDGLENWKCVNNARNDHPLPLPGTGFWEGAGATGVNKNYAAINGDHWVVLPIGVRSRESIGLVSVGAAKQKCHVEAYNPARAYLGKDAARVAEADLAAGEAWQLPGRADTMAAYLITGTYV